MKKFGKVLAVIAGVIVVIAGIFWFNCRVVNHRSFMAGFVDLFLEITHRSDKFSDVEICEAFLDEKAVTNQEPVELPKAKFDVTVREDTSELLQAFIYNDQEAPAQTVFYFHGGAYVNQPNNQQLTMAARTAAETGAEVVLIVYPKAPVYTCAKAYEVCEQYYLDYVEKNACGKIVMMGDSAGGGFALGLAEKLKAEGKTGPEELVLISPWADASMDNPDLEQYLEHDPMLGIPGLRRIAEVWAGDLDLKDYRVSPMYGDLSGLCPVTLFTGTWEVLYPDCIQLQEKLEAAGVESALTVGERMIHCYPITPVPEAKDAQKIIWDAITR